MDTILITGASGFLGRASLQCLLGEPFQIEAVAKGSPNLPLEGNLHWQFVDLLAPRQAKSLIEQTRPEYLLHLAWTTTPGDYWTSPANQAWLDASIELFQEFTKYGRRCVIAGSCAEYDWSAGICKERLTPTRPTSIYGQCKLQLSQVVQQLAEDNGVSLAWARLFFLYGPFEKPGRFISSVIQSLLNKQAARCFHPTLRRDWMFVEDAAAALCALLFSGVEGPVNIATGEASSNGAIASKIGKLMDSQELVMIEPTPQAEAQPLVVGDIMRLRTEVNWHPGFSLEESLLKTIAWWKTAERVNATNR